MLEQPGDDATPAAPDRRVLVIGAGLVGAILAGATLAVLVTFAAERFGGGQVGQTSPVAATATPATSTSDPRPPTPTNAPTPAEASTRTASPSRQPTPSPDPTPTHAPEGGGLPEGCFSDGLERESDAPPEDLVIAEDLERRLPLPGVFSEPHAWVGSSANELFVSAFAECTGADPATIRFGTVSGGLTLGAIPFAIQIDGYTGAQLAPILLEGMLHPEQRESMVIGHHDRWAYLMHESGFAVTASADTLYWIQLFCCVDIMNPDAELPSFKDIVHDYLDRTDDEPGPMRGS